MLGQVDKRVDLARLLGAVGSCVFSARQLAAVSESVLGMQKQLSSNQIKRLLLESSFDFVKRYPVKFDNTQFYYWQSPILCKTDLEIIIYNQRESILCISEHDETCVLSHFDESLGDLPSEGEEGPRNASK